jgi:hypothetical protein
MGLLKDSLLNMNLNFIHQLVTKEMNHSNSNLATNFNFFVHSQGWPKLLKAFTEKQKIMLPLLDVSLQVQFCLSQVFFPFMISSPS